LRVDQATSCVPRAFNTSANPTRSDDVGRCEVGHYTIDGDLLTMCDAEGVALRNSNTGERITHRLGAGENRVTIAKRLTLKIWREARGDDTNGFNRRIEYPKWGGV
jgi:hypothetical protein